MQPEGAAHGSTGVGPELDRTRSRTGVASASKSDRNWTVTGVGPVSDRSWTGVGTESDRSRNGVGTELERSHVWTTSPCRAIGFAGPQSCRMAGGGSWGSSSGWSRWPARAPAWAHAACLPCAQQPGPAACSTRGGPGGGSSTSGGGGGHKNTRVLQKRGR